jgi:2-desacetyl-2-hydroxyethyl bacteriochlorophyllide A dehydrogenase
MGGAAAATRTAVPDTGTMRAAVLGRPGEARIDTTPLPEPGPGEVLLRVEGCGVCGSNVPVWTGAAAVGFPLAPGEPGHEVWGKVAACGPGARGVEVGSRVVALGHRGFAEYDVAGADTAVLLPPGLDGVPVPGEALACAVNVLRRADVRAGQSVAVVGVGFLGALLVQLCAAAGASVVALSRRRFSLEVAERMGARAADSREDALELNGGASFPCVIEAAGAQETLDLASALVGVRGRLVIAGYHQGGPRTVDLQGWNWHGIDVVNAHERDPAEYVRGMREAVELLAAGRLDPSPLYTHRFPLERVGDALAAAAERPEGFVKALVEP